MFRPVLLVAAGLVFSAVAADIHKAPVLVELFTSEGCSSCPPADKLLGQIDRQAVVLSEHVDYWDHLGWKDRFSSHVFTERQENYAHQFHIDGPYTPQMVVDGRAEFNGSDARRASNEIGLAAGIMKAEVSLTRVGSAVQVEIPASPLAADVMMAVADDGASSDVRAGENKGHELHHVAVVRSLRKIGTVKRGAYFAIRVDLPAVTIQQRIVVFLQEPNQGHVLGVGLLRASGI